MFHRITFEKEELEKLADYILFNKKIDLAKNVYFNRNTLIRLRSILNGSKPNNFKMNKKQFDEIINSFLNSKLSFNNNTPSIILNNHDCIIASLKRDINSVDYLKNVRDPELINEIKSIVKEKEYVLSSSSPLYLRSDPEIALKSIKIDPFSADYVAWHTMNNSTSDLICKELSKTDYVIHTLSPHYLLSNDDVILNSIKNDFSTIQYADLSDVKDKELFEYLVMNDFSLSSSYVFEQQLSNFTNPRVLFLKHI